MRRTEVVAVEALRAVLEPRGVTLELIRGGKHLSVVATAPSGRWTKIPVAGSPRGDEGCQINVSRQAAYRALYEIGLTDDRGEPSYRPVRKVSRPRRMKAVGKLKFERVEGGPSRDPWAGLTGLFGGAA